MSIPIALTIAGSDCSGGAGIQADLKSFAARGVYGASVITALTAQNTQGVTGVHDVPPDFITAQIDAVFVRSRRPRGEDRHGVAARGDRGDRRRSAALDAPRGRARPGDGGDLGRSSAGRRRGRGVAHAIGAACQNHHPESAGGGGVARRGNRHQRRRDRGPGPPAAGARLRCGADQGRPRPGALEHRLSGQRRPGRWRCRRRASPPRTPTAPAARCRRRSPPNSPRAAIWKPRCAAPRAWVSAAIAAADQLAVGHGHGPIHHFHGFRPTD